MSQSAQSRPAFVREKEPDELTQQLDADSLALSKIPADPLIVPDPLAPVFRPVNKLVDVSIQSIRLKFGATYTFLNQYATITPDGVRHNQLSGRLDFTGAWAVYEHGSTAGSISMLVRSGIILIKYWFSITDEEQHLRFTMRIHDPLKQWKLSPMDVEARTRWEQYTKAKEAMLEHTHIAEAPWHVVEAVDKKKARLNCIAHLLEQIPYQEVTHDPVILPARVRNPDYHRGPVPPELYVPARY